MRPLYCVILSLVVHFAEVIPWSLTFLAESIFNLFILIILWNYWMSIPKKLSQYDTIWSSVWLYVSIYLIQTPRWFQLQVQNFEWKIRIYNCEYSMYIHYLIVLFNQLKYHWVTKNKWKSPQSLREILFQSSVIYWNRIFHSKFHKIII